MAFKLSYLIIKLSMYYHVSKVLFLKGYGFLCFVSCFNVNWKNPCALWGRKSVTTTIIDVLCNIASVLIPFDHLEKISKTTEIRFKKNQTEHCFKLILEVSMSEIDESSASRKPQLFRKFEYIVSGELRPKGLCTADTGCVYTEPSVSTIFNHHYYYTLS